MPLCFLPDPWAYSNCTQALVDRTTTQQLQQHNNRYHHFIVMSDVDRLDDKGVPLDKNGRPVTYVLPRTIRQHSNNNTHTHTHRICEYSNLVSTAAAEVVRDGLFKFFSNCAPFHELPLHDYTSVCTNIHTKNTYVLFSLSLEMNREEESLQPTHKIRSVQSVQGRHGDGET